MCNTPTLEEVRRHWGLAVDIHRREERLAAFDRMIEATKAEVWDEGARASENLTCINPPCGVCENCDAPLANPYRENS